MVFIGPRAQAILARCNRKRWPETMRGFRHLLDVATTKAKVGHYSPNQLRHTAATRICERFGVEAARTVLGHGVGNATTSIYAERDYNLAEKVMLEMG